MIKDIFITSSSYIIPNHYGWENLKGIKLNFDSIGNLSSGFYKTNKNKTLFCKIFVNDLVNLNENEKKLKKKNKNNNKKFNRNH